MIVGVLVTNGYWQVLEMGCHGFQNFFESCQLDAKSIREGFFIGHFSILGWLVFILQFSLEKIMISGINAKKNEISGKAKHKLTEGNGFATWV